MEVKSSDHKKCGICVRVSGKQIYRNTLNQVADMFRIDRNEIQDVLENWSEAQMRKHLEKFSAEILNSLPAERRFKEFEKKAMRSR